jgi:hypothetical protein
MSAYMRLIIGEKGKVIKVIMDSLYHPNAETMEYIDELLNDGGTSLEFVDEEINDAEVLVIFHPHTYPSHHPLDPVEYETDLIIKQTVVLKAGYKEHYRKEVQELVKRFIGCMMPAEKIEDLIGEWEELYDEDFYEVNKESSVENEDDPFDVFRHEWKNTFNA